MHVLYVGMGCYGVYLAIGVGVVVQTISIVSYPYYVASTLGKGIYRVVHKLGVICRVVCGILGCIAVLCVEVAYA